MNGQINLLNNYHKIQNVDSPLADTVTSEVDRSLVDNVESSYNALYASVNELKNALKEQQNQDDIHEPWKSIDDAFAPISKRVGGISAQFEHVAQIIERGGGSHKAAERIDIATSHIKTGEKFHRNKSLAEELDILVEGIESEYINSEDSGDYISGYNSDIKSKANKLKEDIARLQDSLETASDDLKN